MVVFANLRRLMGDKERNVRASCIPDISRNACTGAGASIVGGRPPSRVRRSGKKNRICQLQNLREIFEIFQGARSVYGMVISITVGGPDDIAPEDRKRLSLPTCLQKVDR